MPSLWSRIKAAASIGNNDSWSNPTAQNKPVQQPVQKKPVVNLQALQNALHPQQQPLQRSIQTAKFGVLKNNPQAQQNLLKDIQPKSFAGVRNVAGAVANTDKAVYNGVKSATGSIANTAQLPFTAGRLGIANLTGNKVAANNARSSAVSDAKNNMFWNESYNKTGNILAGAISGNHYLDKNRQANDKLNQTLKTAYGNRPLANAQIDAYTSGLNQEDNQRFLGEYGLTPTSSKTETFKKVGLPVISTGAQIALNATGVGAGAKVAANQAVKQGLRQEINQVGKQAIGFGAANAGIGAADVLSSGGSNTDALKAGTTGFLTGAALPVAGFAGGKVLKGATNIVDRPQLTPELLKQRNGLLVGYNKALDSGRHDLAQGIAKQIDAIDATTKTRLKNPLTPLNQRGYVRLSDGKDITPKATKADAYGISHRPSEDGAFAHDLSQNGQFAPKDIYDHPEWYQNLNGDYGVASRESFNALKSVRNNPDTEITIYRTNNKNELNAGDWVTPSKKYAEMHLASNGEKGDKVHAFRVKAKELKWPGDDMNELGFFPEKTKKPLPKPLNQGGYIQLPGKAPQVGKTEPVAQTKTVEAPPKVNQPQTAVDFEPTTMTQTQAAPPVPPSKPPVGETPPQLGPGKTKKTAYSNKTVKNSPYVSEGVKEKLNSPEYNVNTEKQAYQESGKRYQQVGEDNFIANSEQSLEQPLGNPTRQDIVDAQSAAALLETKGDEASLARAANIYDKISEHLTAAGQRVQAAAILSRQTPQGLMFRAQRTLRQAGIDLTPELQTQLTQQIERIKATKPGKDRNYEVAKLEKTIADNIPPDLADKILSTWKAGLLSGVKTQTGNFLSNGIFGILHDISNPLAAGIDKGISLISKQRTKTLTEKGRLSGIGEGLGHAKRFMQTGVDERQATIGKYEGHNGRIFKNKVANTYVEGIFKLMGAADRPAYYSQLKNSIYDIAVADAKTRGFKGQERANYIQEYLNNPPSGALETAVMEANKAVLNYDTIASKAFSGVANVINKIPPEGKIGKFAAKLAIGLNSPFVRVPSAFLSRTIDFTALGVPKEVLHQISQRKFDQRALSTAISEATTGTALLATGVALADSNLLTGEYPTDPKEQERWKAQGIQPNSVKVGDTYLSLNYMGPVGIIFSASNHIKKARNQGSSAIGQAGQAVAGVPKSLLQQSFIQGVSNAAQAVNDPGRFAGKYVNQLAGSVIPTLSNDIASATDSAQREVNNVKDAVASRIPGLREKLAKAQDVYGNDLARSTNAVSKLINPLRPSDAVTNNVKSEVERLHNIDPNNTDLQVTPTPVDKLFKESGATTPLNDKQRHDLQKQIGQATQTAWGKMITSPLYQKMPDEEKAKALVSLRQDVTANTKRQYAATNNLGQYSPDFNGKADKATLNQKRLANGVNPSNYTQKSSTSDGGDNITPKEAYSTAVEDFNLNKDTYSTPQRMKKQDELNRLKVASNYNKDVVDFYTMSEKEVGDYLNTKETGVDKKKIYDRLIAYDQALKDAGITKTLKFKNGIANSSWDTGSGKGKTSRVKIKPNLARTKISISRAPSIKPKSFKVAKPKSSIPVSYKPKKVKIKTA